MFEEQVGEYEKKIPYIIGLATTAVLSTKINEVENKNPTATELVNKTDYDVETSDMEKKYSTTADFTKLASETLKETHDSSFI